MGEEEKGKEEEKPKVEEEKKKDEGETKPVAAAAAAAAEEEVTPPPPPPPPPEEIVMRVFMHCEGCARKVRRCLKGFDGVEEVKTDCRSWKVVVKGKKAAEDPLKVVERVQKKSGRKVELLSPMPPPKVEKKEEEEKKVEEEKPKIEEKKEEPVVISVVLKVHMHCEACAQAIKKRILKMKGVQAAEADLKSSQVTVKGVFTSPELVEYVHKRTGKHAAVVKQEPAEKKPEPAPETEPKTDSTPAVDSNDKPEAAAGDAAAAAEKKDEASTDAGAAKEKDASGEAAVTAAEEAKVVEMKKYEYLYYQRYPPMEYAYPPQIFSDENPNACAVM